MEKKIHRKNVTELISCLLYCLLVPVCELKQLESTHSANLFILLFSSARRRNRAKFDDKFSRYRNLDET